MATKTLVREPVYVAGLKPLTEDQMMAEVREVLGYQLVDAALQLRRVGEILRSLDIEPFDVKTVDAYKKEIVAEAKKKEPKRRTDSYYYNRITWTWKAKTLKDYQQPVPAFALVRAAQVQKALNAANIPAHFEVEELHRTERRVRKPEPDPFMVLVLGKHRLYIDVWNEPKFEGRRTA